MIPFIIGEGVFGISGELFSLELKRQEVPENTKIEKTYRKEIFFMPLKLGKGKPCEVGYRHYGSPCSIRTTFHPIKLLKSQWGCVSGWKLLNHWQNHMKGTIAGFPYYFIKIASYIRQYLPIFVRYSLQKWNNYSNFRKYSLARFPTRPDGSCMKKYPGTRDWLASRGQVSLVKPL